MSVYLIYFEKNQPVTDGNFGGFADVGNYPLPGILSHEEDVAVVHRGKKFRASLIFDGFTSGDFYGHNQTGEDYRNTLKKFIAARLENSCVQSFVYLNVFSGADFDGSPDILLPDDFDTVTFEALEDVFRQSVFQGFFRLLSDVQKEAA
jgi:hypothetical protein